MRIGFFTDVYTPQIDGVVRAIKLYKKALEDQGHEVFIFAPKGLKRGSIFDFILGKEKNVFRFYAINSLFIPGYPLTIPISLKATRKIPKLNLDIVHCHTPLSMGMLGDMVALFSNVPQIFTYHTYYSEYAKHYFEIGKLKEPTAKVIRKLESFYCNRADLVIAPSQKLKDVLENKMGVETETKILPTGVDFSEFKNVNGDDFIKKYPELRDKKILLYVGRLGTEKNVEFLIDMLPKVLEREENARLVIVGDGKRKKYLKDKVREMNLDKQVLFTGFLDRKKTLKAFKACHIFVFASQTDTQGLVLSEAAASSKPLVMLDDPGLTPIAVQDRNAFFSSENVDEFAGYVLKLLQDESLYAKMASNSREIVKDLSIENQARKLVELYEKKIEYHRGSSWRIGLWKKLNKKIEMPFKFNGKLEKFKKLFK